MDADRVEHPVYHIKGMRLANHKRRHHSVIFSVFLSAEGKELDGLSAGMSVRKIRRGDFRDSLRVNILIFHGLSAHKGGQNRNFAAGVVSFHIRFRVPLRIALFLGFLQHFFITGAVFFHLG